MRERINGSSNDLNSEMVDSEDVNILIGSQQSLYFQT